MATFHIAKQFTLTRDDTSSRQFYPGVQSFKDDDPDMKHWYFLANAKPVADDGAALPAAPSVEDEAKAKADAEALAFAAKATSKNK